MPGFVEAHAREDAAAASLLTVVWADDRELTSSARVNAVISTNAAAKAS